MTMPLPSALSVEGLAKSFGGVHALDEVSLSVPQGERRGLIGPNGAGKTTLFNLISGEVYADRGRVRLFGRDVTHLSIQDRVGLGLGRTYQVTNVFLDLTVEENLFLAAASRQPQTVLRSWRADERRRTEARAIADLVGLDGALSVRVDTLGHGERRLLEIGIALALRPRLLLLDEPAAGLAPAERLRIMGFLRELDREITVILVEHDMGVVLGLADRITVLHQGRVIAEGPPDEVRVDPHVQQVYMGEWVNRE